MDDEDRRDKGRMALTAMRARPLRAEGSFSLLYWLQQDNKRVEIYSLSSESPAGYVIHRTLEADRFFACNPDLAGQRAWIL